MSPKPNFALFRNIANRQTTKDDNNMDECDSSITVDF